FGRPGQVLERSRKAPGHPPRRRAEHEDSGPERNHDSPSAGSGRSRSELERTEHRALSHDRNVGIAFIEHDRARPSKTWRAEKTEHGRVPPNAEVESSRLPELRDVRLGLGMIVPYDREVVLNVARDHARGGLDLLRGEHGDEDARRNRENDGTEKPE